MRRWYLVVVGVLIAGAGLAWVGVPALARVKAPIRVGLLHSLTGPMAISERSMVDAEKLAIDELNEGGGLLGRRVEWVEADGKSDDRTFAREAERLITVEKVSLIVGCWTSASRKNVKQVVERFNHLLIYPVAYEGLEQSPRIVYTGAAPNQQVIPTVKWCHDVLKAKSFFLVGTDTVWPHAVNTIIKDQIKALGAELAGEEYVELGSEGVGAAVEKMVKARPDVILSTLEGEVNQPFYKALRGGQGSKIPAVTFSMAEDELRDLPVKQMVNDYSVCNYFQAIDRPENLAFVGRFKAKYGEKRVTSDSIATAYSSIHLWAQAVREAETAEVSEVRPVLLRQSRNAPEGVISIDRESQHTWRPFFVGRIQGDGRIEIVQTVSKPIRPAPFPFSKTRDEWEEYLESLSAGWNGNWGAGTSTRSARSSE